MLIILRIFWWEFWNKSDENPGKIILRIQKSERLPIHDRFWWEYWELSDENPDIILMRIHRWIWWDFWIENQMKIYGGFWLWFEILLRILIIMYREFLSSWLESWKVSDKHCGKFLAIIPEGYRWES